MTYLLEIIKTIGGPGSSGFLVSGLVIGLVAYGLWPGGRRGVVWLGAALLLSYVAMATPAVAVPIINALPLVPAPPPATVTTVRTLVVFDGDNLAGRRRRAERVLRQAAPTDVYLLGAEHLLADLRVAMPSWATLHHDTTTWNTSSQVARVQQIVQDSPPTAAAIIASRIQMPRIAALMDSAGVRTLLVPSDLDQEPRVDGVRRFVPTFATLHASRDAIYEHAALAWYRWRGDIR